MPVRHRACKLAFTQYPKVPVFTHICQDGCIIIPARSDDRARMTTFGLTGHGSGTTKDTMEGNILAQCEWPAPAVPERVLIVDHHTMVRAGLRSIFQDRHPTCQIEEAGSLMEAVAILEADRTCSLMLLDLDLPDTAHLSGIRRLRLQYPGVPILAISATCDRHLIRNVIAMGGRGFMPKTLPHEDIVLAVDLVLAGEIYAPRIRADVSLVAEEDAIHRHIDTLTPQQRLVLSHLVAGHLNKQIAHELGVSMTTVKAHVSAILRKMHVLSRTQAVIQANRAGFVE